MTSQEIFDTVVSHLRNQNQKCTNVYGECLYRNGAGLKCAAGCLIKDEDYDPKFEGIAAWDIGYFDKYDIKQQDVIWEMQLIHDRYPIPKWEERFEIIALQHNLKYTPKD